MYEIEYGQHRIALVGINKIEKSAKRSYDFLKGKWKSDYKIKLDYADETITLAMDGEEEKEKFFDEIRDAVIARTGSQEELFGPGEED